MDLPQIGHLDPARNWRKRYHQSSSTLSGKKSIDGQVTLHGYLITVGPSEQQSGPKEIGPQNNGGSMGIKQSLSTYNFYVLMKTIKNFGFP